MQETSTRRPSTASQETLVSLQQLDPSPIDSPVLTPQTEPALPKTSSASTLGLSGSGAGHSAIYYLTRLQRYSSYAFSIYTTLHITNTSLIPLLTRSVPASEPYLLLTRPYYQSTPFEALLVTLPLTTHILSGFFLRLHRRSLSLSRYGASHLPLSSRLSTHLKIWPPISWASISGYALIPLLGVHVLVNRTIPWIYEGGSSGVGLGYVSHGFAKHPMLAWTGYVALIGTGVGHIVWGVARWGGFVKEGKGKEAKRRWWGINAVAVLGTLVWMAGGLGVVARGGSADGWVGRGYDKLYSKVPLVEL